MTPDIPALRLANQQLLGTLCTTPQQLVRHLGAIQAQDVAMSRWAVGVRLGTSEAAVAAALDSGAVLRTHVLRPTWHLVAPEDIRWMLALTAPHVKRLYLSTGKLLGMDAATLTRYNKIIAKTLHKRRFCTRDELMRELKLPGTMPNDLRPSLVMMHAEQEALVCSGPMRGKDITYALMDDIVPACAPLAEDEALAMLAQRYFASHGPATLSDFGWWSGLSVANSKKALQQIKHDLMMLPVGQTEYWYADPVPTAKVKTDVVHLLPAFDEILISYKDRTPAIETHHQPKAFTRNGIFKPVVTVNGKVAGTWKRTIKGNNVTIETDLFVPVKKAHKTAIASCVHQFGTYLDKQAILQ